ncbi:unnamed protein product, partial [marine sediment metagenome]
YDATTTQFTRVTTGTPAGRSSFNTSLSGDGTVVVFMSDADFLGQGVPADHEEVWLYDTKTMQYTRVTSVTESRHDYDPSLNADGTVVAFSSRNDLLNEGTGSHTEVWLYHTTTMTYTRVTSATDGNRYSRRPDLNADGTVVGFDSNSDLLMQGMPDTQTEVWLYDTGTTQYTRVTTSSAAGRNSWEPSLNADGTIVSFHGDSDFLNQGIVAGQYEAWLCDTGTMQHTRVTSATYDNRKV